MRYCAQPITISCLQANMDEVPLDLAAIRELILATRTGEARAALPDVASVEQTPANLRAFDAPHHRLPRHQGGSHCPCPRYNCRTERRRWLALMATGTCRRFWNGCSSASQENGIDLSGY
jgi:hypothetical protein